MCQIKILSRPGKVTVFGYGNEIGQLFLIHKYLRFDGVITKNASLLFLTYENMRATFVISYKKKLSIIQKYMNFTNKNLHVTINVTQKRLGVNENHAGKMSGISLTKCLIFLQKQRR